MWSVRRGGARTRAPVESQHFVRLASGTRHSRLLEQREDRRAARTMEMRRPRKPPPPSTESRRPAAARRGGRSRKRLADLVDLADPSPIVARNH